ncbi:DUF1992 domain-containing protein [Loktanella sp. IMCC34160]|uniref:DnaJ family domain-containing protein n=1 Tax=Loktanella sp. IMCC34160 TaxID=2510646 RepID=UPI00101B649D|nr:DUF1992 domain-containing protein [Loktanella sp. IMCC34160]RYG89687.1 DUF1992 domain-containing protein [Loktanella sp. IMCC34160]
MPRWLDKIAERRMLKARAEGKLQGLSCEGKPLPQRPGDAFVDPGEAVGFRIMAEAGALPEEITIKRQIEAVKTRLAGLIDPVDRKAVMAEVSRLQTKLAMAEEARRKFLRD